jgi:2-polyprenyl-3-methyl-5-hydroxy-6-metoxy-1,4-benzoquinol methylase
LTTYGQGYALLVQSISCFGESMDNKLFWENVYTTKSPNEVSWFQEHAELSLKIIRNAGIPTSASIIDVGGGASTLVDDLLAHGYENITVLDLSISALSIAKSRMGGNASTVKWIEGNVLEADFPEQSYDVWHDRAVFHFLTSEQERQIYVRKVLKAVKPGGLVIVATFAEDGPTKCSGLPVMRYSADQLHSEFGEQFQLLGHEKESHHTPGGNEQKFVYCCFKLDGPSIPHGQEINSLSVSAP